MKRLTFHIILMLACLVTSLAGHAQPRPEEDTLLMRQCRVREMREYQGGFYRFSDTVTGRLTRTVTFDQQGRKVREVNHMPNGNLIYTHRYDSLGRISESIQVDESRKSTQVLSYQYDAERRMTEMTTSQAGTVHQLERNTYDDKGRILQQERFSYSGGIPHLQSSTVKEYGPGGQSRFTSFVAGNPSPTGENKQWMNANGDVAREEHWFKDTLHGGWEKFYDTQGHLIKVVSLDHRWKPLSTNYYHWENGLLLTSNFHVQGKPDTAKTVYQYYPNRLPKQFMQKYKGYGQEQSRKFTYDAEGRLIRHGHWSKGREFTWTTYGYDKMGRLITTHDSTSAGPRSYSVCTYYPNTTLVKSRTWYPLGPRELPNYKDEMPDPRPPRSCQSSDTITYHYKYESGKLTAEYLTLTCETEIEFLVALPAGWDPPPILIPGPGPSFPDKPMSLPFKLEVFDTLATLQTARGTQYHLRVGKKHPSDPSKRLLELERSITLRDGKILEMEDRSLSGDVWLSYTNRGGRVTGELKVATYQWKDNLCIQTRPYWLDTTKVILYNREGLPVSIDSLNSFGGKTHAERQYVDGHITSIKAQNSNQTWTEEQFLYDAAGQLIEKRQYFMGRLTIVLCKSDQGRLVEEYTPDISNNSLRRFEYDYYEE